MSEMDQMAALIESVVSVRANLGKSTFKAAVRAARKAVAEVALAEAARLANPEPGGNVVPFRSKRSAPAPIDHDE